MAQSKTILFLGRTDTDTGYSFCVELAKSHLWKLIALTDIENPDVYIKTSDYVFASGYLVALEAFASKKIVLAYYDNPVKKDYWLMHPMVRHIGLNGQVPIKFSQEAYEWANLQTWNKLTDAYEALWQR